MIKGVKLEYLGHCAFRLTTPAGVRIVVDPFRNSGNEQRWFLRPSPPVEADVLVITLDPEFASPAVKLALALQKIINALAVVFVLPPMYREELEALEGYRSVWSLMAAETCEDAEIFAEAVWSASRGINWVDPAMYRRLNEVSAASARRTTPVAGFGE